MQALIQLILLCYKMEGIKVSDVAMLITKEGGADVLRCMAPQQHNVGRAVWVKQRLERMLDAERDDGLHAEVSVHPGRVYADGVSQSMYTVVVQHFPKGS